MSKLRRTIVERGAGRCCLIEMRAAVEERGGDVHNCPTAAAGSVRSKVSAEPPSHAET